MAWGPVPSGVETQWTGSGDDRTLQAKCSEVGGSRMRFRVTWNNGTNSLIFPPEGEERLWVTHSHWKDFAFPNVPSQNIVVSYEVDGSKK